jgi:hypothetical protein
MIIGEPRPKTYSATWDPDSLEQDVRALMPL